MKHFTSTLGAMLAAAVLAAPTTTLAGPLIGLALDGHGHYDTYADLWTNVTDSGLVTKVNVPGKSELRTQTVVGTMSNSNAGTIVTPAGLNSTFEISKIARYQQQVIAQSANSIQFGMAAQDAAMDVDLLHAGVQNVAIYFDRLGPSGGSKAVPGNGANTVRCYGAGTSSAGCGVGDADNGDGLLIMSGQLVFNEATFTRSGTNPNIGTGSFSTSFRIDFVNADFLDVVTGSIISDNFTGTTNLPSFYNPVRAWDGMESDGSFPFFKVDSSQSFAAAAVPEPATLALFGLGLAGLALGERRKIKAMVESKF